MNLKTKQISDFNSRTSALFGYLLKSNNFQPNVLDFQIDNSLNPGVTPTLGDRYVITAEGNLHANFGTINRKFIGYNQQGEQLFEDAILANNDVVEYMNDTTDKFVITYQSAIEGKAAVTVSESNQHLYRFDFLLSSWIDEGSAYEPSFTEYEDNHSPSPLVAVDTRYEIILSHTPKTGFIVQVFIEGICLGEVDTSVSGVDGFEYPASAANKIYVRVPYIIDTTEIIKVIYKY